jgi:hypothetical protein
MTKIIFLFLFFLANEGIKSNTTNYEQEKLSLHKMRDNIDIYLGQIEKMQNKINLGNAIEEKIKINQSCENENKNCVSILELNQFKGNKIVKVLRVIDHNKIFNSTEEKLLNFHIFNLNKIDALNIHKHRADNKNNNEENFLLIFFTTKNLIFTNNQGEIIFTYSISNFSSNIIKVDFSNFDEDNSIIMISHNLELSSITVEMKIYFEQNNKLKLEIFIPLRKSISINNNSKLTYLTQHKLHGHKYIILAFEDGNIFVLNKDLEMKSSVVTKRMINNVFLKEGIMGLVSKNKVMFLNVLGGNAVLLQCNSFYNILDGHYDINNNFLFLLDDHLNLLIYNIKLSIAKQTSNECGFLYKFTLPSHLKGLNITYLNISRNILYLLVDSKYLMIIDMNSTGDKGIVPNEYLIISEEVLRNEDMISLDKKLYSIFTPTILNTSPGHILINDNQNFIILQFKNLKRISAKEAENNSKTAYRPSKHSYFSSLPHSNSDSSSHIIPQFLFKIFKAANNNIFYVYVCVIIFLSVVVFYYNKKKQREQLTFENVNKKKFSNDDEKMLEDMLSSMKEVTKKTKSLSKKTKNKNLDKIDEEDDYSFTDIEEEEEDYGEGGIDPYADVEESEIDEEPDFKYKKNK